MSRDDSGQGQGAPGGHRSGMPSLKRLRWQLALLLLRLMDWLDGSCDHPDPHEVTDYTLLMEDE